MPNRFAFVFVCQAGSLETKALLLAASLKRNLKVDHELIAAVPQPAERWGTLAPATVEMLKQLGVRVEPITNEIDPNYPIGNKVSCMRLKTDADRLVFVDTDIVLLTEFAGDPAFDQPFAAKPADFANVSQPRHWRRAYAAMGLKLPAGRTATTMYGQLTPPYFNSGFVAVDAGAGLGDVWLEACRKVDGKWGIPLKRPHLDQIALAVAVEKLRLKYRCLDERFNYPVHLKAIDVTRPPLFAHYHKPDVARREPSLVQLIRELADEHPALAERLKADPEWNPLFARTLTSFAVHTDSKLPPAPELLITGIPRSGTSYLCNVLHRFENCVVLNEPEEISRPLRKEPIPFGVGTFCRDVRRDVLEGRPIRNKLKNGMVTDETVGANDQAEYTPTVAGPDFVLGLKSPLAFVSRLDALRRAMPNTKIACCVRNPLDTLASWKTTFSHLLSADVRQMTHGGLRDPFLSKRQRTLLEDVAGVADPAWRRAAWWRYLAELILDAGPNVIVITYPQAVTDPAGVASRLFEGHNPGGTREPVEPSTIRAGKRDALDDNDIQAIHALCAEPAAALGIDLV